MVKKYCQRLFESLPLECKRDPCFACTLQKLVVRVRGLIEQFCLQAKIAEKIPVQPKILMLIEAYSPPEPSDPASYHSALNELEAQVIQVSFRHFFSRMRRRKTPLVRSN